MIKDDLKELADIKKADILQGFFKTGKGEYGEGDIFLGLNSQQIKDTAEKYKEMNLKEIKSLLASRIHEDRACALRILTYQYQRLKQKQQEKEIVDFYLANRQGINNWDLVDMSSYKIIGDFLIDKDKNILYELARGNLWERRIAVVSCYAFIRHGDFKDILRISELLLDDKEDLIHKAVGWMLRETGKRDENTLINFLEKNYKKMPRTMLRYAIEKIDEEKRKGFLIKRTK